MQKIRVRNWLILLSFAFTYLLLSIQGIDGFWNGFLIGVSFAVFVGEVYWIVKGREVKSYVLQDHRGKS